MNLNDNRLIIKTLKSGDQKYFPWFMLLITSRYVCFVPRMFLLKRLKK
jgi:hypothetical protein